MNTATTNVGRPMQFDPEAALAKATEVFHAKGYDATSTTNLMEAMNLSKSSLYQTFGSKHQLFMRCLDQYSNQAKDYFSSELANAKSGKDFLIDLFRSMVDPAKKKDNECGCLLVNTACEFGDTDKSMSEFIKARVAGTSELLAQAIVRGQSEGDISPEKDAKKLADSLMVSLYGIRVLAKLNPDKSLLEPAMNQIIQQLE